MRIEDDGSGKVDRNNRIDLIRQMQEQEQASKVDDKKTAQAQEVTRQAQQVNEAQNVQDVSPVDEAAKTTKDVDPQERQDIQGVVGAQELAGTETKQVDGTARSAEAVDSAHKQQERGEGWEKFAERDETKAPASVEETARQEKQQDQERLSARQLQNELAIKKKMIRS